MCSKDNGAPGRMFDASLERLSVTETSYNNSLAERAPRSTIQTLPATLPEPWSKAREPRSVIKETSGARAAIGDGRSGLMGFGRQIAGGASWTAGLGLGFWQTSRGSGVWLHGGYCAQPPCSKSHGKQASPPSSRCTVHAQGVKS